MFTRDGAVPTQVESTAVALVDDDPGVQSVTPWGAGNCLVDKRRIPYATNGACCLLCIGNFVGHPPKDIGVSYTGGTDRAAQRGLQSWSV
jgi:hypothetical protein